jgi:hypothetical protein
MVDGKPRRGALEPSPMVPISKLLPDGSIRPIAGD